MSPVGKLLGSLADRGMKADAVVTCSPTHKDKRLFYCYSGSEIRYVVTVVGAGSPAATAFHTADQVIRRLRARIADAPTSRCMLFPCSYFELDGQMYLVSDYVRRALRVIRIARLPYSDFRLLLSGSSKWILKFQEQTMVTRPSFDAVEAFETRFVSWTARHRDLLPKESDSFQRTFLAAWRTLSQRLPIAARHGDYCSCNYFYDRDGQFRVIDWEFAAEQDCVACDFFSNVVAYAGCLGDASVGIGSQADVLDRGGTRNKYVRGLQDSICHFENKYSVSPLESRVLFVYAHLHLMMRLRTRATIAAKAKFFPELLDVLPT